MELPDKTQTQCLNCETVIQVSDEFCSHCGQENRELKISFWELISEFLSSNFNFDTKLGRTLIDLFLKPGEITKQFIAGKRVRYVKPIQMYLFISFIYFLIAGIDPPSFVNKTPPSQSELDALNKSELVEVNIDDTELASISDKLNNVDPNNDSEIDSLMVELGETEITPWKRHLAKQAIKSLRDNNDEALTQEVYANLSVAMFVLLPLFAALLWLFVRRKSPFYFDALIFSIHFHSVVLLVFALNMIVALMIDETLVFKIALALIFLYLIMSLKRVFELSWLKSFGKSLGLALTYSFVFGLCYLSVLAISFWMY